MPVIEISFETTTPKNSAEFMTTNGTDIILIRLTIAVNEIDKATSPSANLVNTFEAVSYTHLTLPTNREV